MKMRTAHFPDTAPIDAYGNGGFRFAGMSHRGSIMALPSGIYAWEPADPAALTMDDFGLLDTCAPLPRVLLLGLGARLDSFPTALMTELRTRGIQPEPMDTGAAARTYNVLLAEGRSVGAALVAVN